MAWSILEHRIHCGIACARLQASPDSMCWVNSSCILSLSLRTLQSWISPTRRICQHKKNEWNSWKWARWMPKTTTEKINAVKLCADMFCNQVSRLYFNCNIVFHSWRIEHLNHIQKNHESHVNESSLTKKDSIRMHVRYLAVLLFVTRKHERNSTGKHVWRTPPNPVAHKFASSRQ